MPGLRVAYMYGRFLIGLRGYLRNTITLAQARDLVKERLTRRTESLLLMAERSVFSLRTSPYRELLRLAGCELGDFVALVNDRGVEGALLAPRGTRDGPSAHGKPAGNSASSRRTQSSSGSTPARRPLTWNSCSSKSAGRGVPGATYPHASPRAPALAATSNMGVNHRSRSEVSAARRPRRTSSRSRKTIHRSARRHVPPRQPRARKVHPRDPVRRGYPVRPPCRRPRGLPGTKAPILGSGAVVRDGAPEAPAVPA